MKDKDFGEMLDMFIPRMEFDQFEKKVFDKGATGGRFKRERMGEVDISGGRKIQALLSISLEERIHMIEEKLGMYKNESEV